MRTCAGRPGRRAGGLGGRVRDELGRLEPPSRASNRAHVEVVDVDDDAHADAAPRGWRAGAVRLGGLRLRATPNASLGKARNRFREYHTCRCGYAVLSNGMPYSLRGRLVFQTVRAGAASSREACATNNVNGTFKLA
jgi:hypothetical protein